MQIQVFHKSRVDVITFQQIGEMIFKINSMVGALNLNLMDFQEDNNCFKFQYLNLFFIIDDNGQKFLDYYHERTESMENGFIYKIIYPDFKKHYDQYCSQVNQYQNIFSQPEKQHIQFVIQRYLSQYVWQFQISMNRAMLGRLSSKMSMMFPELKNQIKNICLLNGTANDYDFIPENIQIRSNQQLEFFIHSTKQNIFSSVEDSLEQFDTEPIFKIWQNDQQIDITLSLLINSFISLNQQPKEQKQFVDLIKDQINCKHFILNDKHVEKLFLIGLQQEAVILFCIVFIKQLKQFKGKELFSAVSRKQQIIENLLKFDSMFLHQLALLCFNSLSQIMFKILTETRYVKAIFQQLYEAIFKENKNFVQTIKDPANVCQPRNFCSKCTEKVQNLNAFYSVNLKNIICEKCYIQAQTPYISTKMNDFHNDEPKLNAIFGDFQSNLLQNRKKLLNQLQTKFCQTFIAPVEQYQVANQAVNLSQLLSSSIVDHPVEAKYSGEVYALNLAQIPRELSFCLLIWHFGYVKHKNNIYTILQNKLKQMSQRMIFIYFQNCPQEMLPSQYELNQYCDIYKVKTNRTQFLDVNFALYMHRTPECKPFLIEIFNQLVYLIEQSPHLKMFYLLPLTEFVFKNELNEFKQSLFHLFNPQKIHFHTYFSLHADSFISRYQNFKQAEYDDIMQAKLFENLFKNKYLHEILPEISTLSYYTITNLFKQEKYEILQNHAQKILNKLQICTTLIDEKYCEFESPILQEQISLMHLLQHLPFFPNQANMQSIARRTWEVSIQTCELSQGKTLMLYIRALSCFCVKFAFMLQEQKIQFMPFMLHQNYQAIIKSTLKEAIAPKFDVAPGQKSLSFNLAEKKYFICTDLKTVKSGMIIDFGEQLGVFEEYRLDSLQFLKVKQGKPLKMTQGQKQFILIQLEQKYYVMEGKDMMAIFDLWK